jgi:hypothetical protein
MRHHNQVSMSQSDLMTRERQEQIAQMLEDKGRLSVAAISDLLQCQRGNGPAGTWQYWPRHTSFSGVTVAQ